MLQIVDTQWKDHLYSLDHLKEGIGLRGYGQRDPLVEYKKESFALFQDMKGRIEEDMVRYLFLLRPVLNEEAAQVARPAARRAAPLTMNNPGCRTRVGVFGQPRPGGCRCRSDACIRRRRAATRSHRRRRRREDGTEGRAEGGPQRSVPVRQRQEIQEVSRSGSLRLKRNGTED